MPIPRRLGSLLAIVILLPVANLFAQSSTTNFNIAAGVTLPTGDFGDRSETGYNIIVGIGTMQRGTPYGFRAEGFYHEFNQKGTTGTSHAGGASINALYDFMAPTRDQPNTLYGIGGVGFYATREPFYSTDSQTNFGWNIGAGFKFPLSGFSAYVEARYHSVSSEPGMSFIPLSFGLVF